MLFKCCALAEFNDLQDISSEKKIQFAINCFLFDVESLYLSISMTFHVASLLSSLLYVAMFVFFTLSENKYQDFHNVDEGPSQGGKIMI